MDQLSHRRREASGDDAAIVGRQREYDILRQRLRAALAGSGGTVLISGEAGLGKTTLVNHLRRDAIERGALPLTGHCYDLTTTPPYGPWLDLADQLPPGPERSALSQALRGGEEASGPASQAELFEAARAVLTRLSQDSPLVLTLEDLHWADPASLDLLRFLARHFRQLPALLLVTYRGDEVDERHPLFPLLALLVREADAERIELRHLASSEVRKLVNEHYRLPAPDAARLTAYLVEHADGNPLFIREVLKSLEDDGLVRQERGAWTVGALDRRIVPPLIRQLIAGRAGRLSAETWDLLAVAAVIGQEASIDLWSEATEAADDALLTAVEEGIAANFIQATPDGLSICFVHALVREAFYDGMLPIRRRRLHRQVAERLAASRQPDLDAVASHFQRAGDPRAIEWLIAAGDRAFRAYAWRMTVERFDAAAQLMADDPGRARDRGWLLYRIGRMLRMSNPAEGVERLQEAERLARATGDEVLAAYAQADAGLVRCFAGDIRRGIEEMSAGVAALDALPADHLSRDPQVAAWVADALRTTDAGVPDDAPLADPPTPHNLRRATLALWMANVGPHREAAAIAEACRREVADAPDLTELVAGSLGDALFALGISYGEMARPAEADDAFNRAREVYQSFDHHELVSGTAANHLWIIAMPYCTTDQARLRWLVAESEAARSRGSGAMGGAVAPASSGSVAPVFPMGWWEEDRPLLDAALEQTNAGLRFFAVCAHAWVAWGQGNVDVAWQQIRDTLASGPDTEPGGQAFDPSVELQRLAVILALDAGDTAAARAWLDAHIRWIDWAGANRHRPGASLLWARYHHAVGDSESARQYAEEAHRLASDPRQPLTLVAAQRFLGQLDREARNHESAAGRLQEALALADACSAHFDRALTLLERAELRSATGATDDARTLAEEARDICLRLGARPALERADAFLSRLAASPTPAGGVAGLTAREVEVLRLVAQGLTDAEVAERLYLARRTINTHLTNIYTKLNVSNRAAATRWAIENGIT